MNILKTICSVLEQIVIDTLDIAKKTFAVFMVLGYIIMFLWSAITTVFGWYTIGFHASVIGFVMLCLCFGILLHISEKYKRSDDIGGESNEENDTGLCEDSERR